MSLIGDRRWFLTLLIALGLTGCGEKVLDQTPLLRVGTSGDYAPFSFENEAGELVGFDIELAKRFAADNQMELEFTRFQWPDLLKDLAANKFDVAMSGVTVREDRSLAARSTVPTTKSGAVVIVPKDSKVATMGDLDHVGIRIGVNEGGHLERVARKAFSKATIVTSLDNQAVPEMLLAGEIDALVTDTMEVPHWLKRLEGATALSPFTQDRKAWLVHPEKVELADQLDSWLLGIEKDGTFGELRQEHLPDGYNDQTAAPLTALLAAMDERLSLMVGVAESKRVLGKSVEDLEQETRVLSAAVEGVTVEAQRQGIPIPNQQRVTDFFKSQIEAAKAIQYRVLSGPATTLDPPDLVTDLRPALGRISRRINHLIVGLGDDGDLTDPVSLRLMVDEALTNRSLSSEHLTAISSAIYKLEKTQP
jgi:cyclohexadienyl dehydratase